MRRVHYFFIDDFSTFITHLEAQKFSRLIAPGEVPSRISYSKVLSRVLTKFYSYDEKETGGVPIRIGVSYSLAQNGKPLARLAKTLKNLNSEYRHTLSNWKTKRKAREGVRDKRWAAVQKFLQNHNELIACFKYQGDNRMTEGNHSFNLEIASTPKEQAICFEFIKALIDAYEPHGIVRSQRGPDKPREQRNGWIKRYAELHKKRGWTPLEISREIQRELREGTWNERSKLQYNLAQNTILRIAGMKIHPTHASN
jgi:hypothetical protein